MKSGQALSIEEKAFIFAARSNMIDVHANFKLAKQTSYAENARVKMKHNNIFWYAKP